MPPMSLSRACGSAFCGPPVIVTGPISCEVWA